MSYWWFAVSKRGTRPSKCWVSVPTTDSDAEAVGYTFVALTSANLLVHELQDIYNAEGQILKALPKMIKAGFVVGGQHGAGVATCKLASGKWSPPAPFDMTGATFGAQIGGEKQGYVMMIMNDQGLQALMSGHFKVGAGVDAAAGPVGREGSAAAGNNAAILSYANAKGAYVGATLNGAELNQDHGETKALYGQETPFSNILNGKVEMPSDTSATEFVHTVASVVDRAGNEGTEAH